MVDRTTDTNDSNTDPSRWRRVLFNRWLLVGVAAQYEKATGKKAKRPNFVMALMGWASSDTGFYQAMFEELVKLEPLADNELEDLAMRRAEAIVMEIKTTEGLDGTRATAESPGPAEKASTEAVNTKLRLDVMKPSVQVPERPGMRSRRLRVWNAFPPCSDRPS